jgi:hypothetical protein
MGTDKMIPRHVYDKPDRSEWQYRFHPNRKGSLVWYTYGCKTSEGTGGGVHGYGMRKKLRFSLGQCILLFQAEIYAIRAYAVKKR